MRLGIIFQILHCQKVVDQTNTVNLSWRSEIKIVLTCVYKNLIVWYKYIIHYSASYHAIEATANPNTGKPIYNPLTVTVSIISNLPITSHTYVTLIVLATLISVAWYKIVLVYNQSTNQSSLYSFIQALKNITKFNEININSKVGVLAV